MALSSMNESSDFDVAVIGLGPTGATLANLLSLDGLRVVVLERDADIFALPRALHFDGECMRVFQTLGLAETLLPNLFVAPGMKFIDPEGKLLIDWQRPTGVGPQGWCASYKFHQPELERTLRSRLLSRPNVDIRLRHEAFSLEEHADGVAIRYEDTSTGRLGRLQAKYVVGCDGARSIVRRFMGTELDDLKSHERWVVVDAMLNDARPDLGDYSIQYCDPKRPGTYTRGPGNRRRWELMVMPDDEPGKLQHPEWLWDKLSRWITPESATLERSAVYTFHSVIAKGWRNGRLLIAGDAAHQTPPFMGQGMSAGIRDASNLAWKLASVIRGASSDALLDTYESERSPHVRVFIETAVKLGSVIQSRASGDDEASQGVPAELRNFMTPDPSLGPGAHRGDLAHAAIKQNAQDGQHVGGRIGPQPRLADGRLLDDAVGYRYALVIDPDAADPIDEIRERAHAANVAVIVDRSEAIRDWLVRTQATAILVRPDRYVHGVAHDAASILNLLSEVTLLAQAETV